MAPIALDTPCQGMSLRITNEGYKIDIGEKKCKQNKCPFVCQWMYCKNPYLNQELVNIKKMSDQIETSNFNTSIKVIYQLAQNKGNVDKYLPYVDKWLKEQCSKKEQSTATIKRMIEKFEDKLKRLQTVSNQLNEMSPKCKSETIYVLKHRELIHDSFVEYSQLCHILCDLGNDILAKFRVQVEDEEMVIYFNEFTKDHSSDVKSIFDVFNQLLELFRFLSDKPTT